MLTVEVGSIESASPLIQTNALRLCAQTPQPQTIKMMATGICASQSSQSTSVGNGQSRPKPNYPFAKTISNNSFAPAV
jgi:hypothetical protein